MFLLYVFKKFSWALQKLRGTKNIWGALSPNAPRGYEPAMSSKALIGATTQPRGIKPKERYLYYSACCYTTW